jgi:hypothetical protein
VPDWNQLAGAHEIVAKVRFSLPGMFGLAHAPKDGRLDQARTDRVEKPRAYPLRRVCSGRTSSIQLG